MPAPAPDIVLARSFVTAAALGGAQSRRRNRLHKHRGTQTDRPVHDVRRVTGVDGLAPVAQRTVYLYEVDGAVTRAGLAQVAPLILERQGLGKVTAVLMDKATPRAKVRLGDYAIEAGARKAVFALARSGASDVDVMLT